MHRKAHGPLPCLRTDAGALHAADDGGLGGAHIVAVEAGNGKGLQDVKFDAQIPEWIVARHLLAFKVKKV
jgi:hypothetical protein